MSEKTASNVNADAMRKMVLSVGRVVHFVYGDQHVPAIITDPAWQDHGITGLDDVRIAQALTVFPVGEPPFTTIALHDEHCTHATWHWPEHVPAKG